MYTLDPTGMTNNRDYLFNWAHHQHGNRWMKPNVNMGGTLKETIYYEAIQEMVGQIHILLKAKTPPVKYRKDCNFDHHKPCAACTELWEADFPAAFAALRKMMQSKSTWPINQIMAEYPDDIGDKWVRNNFLAPHDHQEVYTRGFMLAFNYPDIYMRMYTYRNELLFGIT